MEPTRHKVNRVPGRVVLEFGTGWCSHCQATQGVSRTVCWL